MREKKIRVLVVDDHRDVATTLGWVLALSGFCVDVHFDSKSALEDSMKFQPDACVLDIDLPEMDGYELAQRLRDKLPNQLRRVIALSCLDEYIPNNGFDLHFRKPTNPLAIVAKLHELDDTQEVQSGVQEEELQAV
jgi:DNA-binding response OmpR family regulator